MTPPFLVHLRHNWPLAVAVAVLGVYLPIVLASGVFFTNQGNVLRSKDPVQYWRWVARLTALLLAGCVVLVGSYLLSRP
jgi:Mn2+/Fe2+ NRAMP family transporter